VPDQDFKLTSDGTCTAKTYNAGDSCTVGVYFNPQMPGVRNGAVVLYDGLTLPANSVTPISGVGTGPAMGFSPTITTVAGNGTNCIGTTLCGDGGSAVGASLSQPAGTAIDGYGNLYIADPNANRIRMVAGTTTGSYVKGKIYTVAGTGTAGYSGDNGLAVNAKLNQPSGVGVDGAGNLYIADTTNNGLRKVDAGSGKITTFVSGLYFSPKYIAVDLRGQYLHQHVGLEKRGPDHSAGQSRWRGWRVDRDVCLLYVWSFC
jgi:sugar lactone lactonase YvrE